MFAVPCKELPACQLHALVRLCALDVLRVTKVLLSAHSARLTYPVTKFIVDVRLESEPEYVNVVPIRDGLNFTEPRILDASREDEMSINPRLSRCQLGKGYSDLECDSRLFRKNLNRPVLGQGENECVEDLADMVGLTLKVLL